MSMLACDKWYSARGEAGGGITSVMGLLQSNQVPRERADYHFGGMAGQREQRRIYRTRSNFRTLPCDRLRHLSAPVRMPKTKRNEENKDVN